METLAGLAIVSFALSLLLTPAVRNLAWRVGWVDHPTDERKIHKTPVPRVGGVAIVISSIAAFVIVDLVGSQFLNATRDQLFMIGRILPGVGLIFCVGLVDDIWGLAPWQKFTGQILAAGLAIGGGVLVDGFAGFEFPIYIAIPLTVFWIVGCSNAVNLIDGMDGLAAGIGLFASITILVSGLLEGNLALAVATAPLAGALLGFLRFNFNPATVFLGDCGSLTVGFVLGCFGAIWSQKSATVLGMTAPLMAMAIPLLDTALAIVRRFLRMTPIWNADRGHIHHRLLDRGMTPRKATLVLYAAACLGAICSILQSTTERSYGGLIIILFCGAAWVGVQHLGYIEFGVAGRMFIEGAFRRQLKAQLSLESFRESLEKAENPVEVYEVIREGAGRFGCDGLTMRLFGSDFGLANRPKLGSGAWQIFISFPEDDFVCLIRNGRYSHATGLAEFAGAVSEGLVHKLKAQKRPRLMERAGEVTRPRAIAAGN